MRKVIVSLKGKDTDKEIHCFTNGKDTDEEIHWFSKG